MVAAERTANKWKRHLGCLRKEGMEARVVTKAESGPEISQMGGRQAGGQMGFLFQNVQSEGTLLTTLLFYTKSELRRNQGPVRVFFFSRVNLCHFLDKLCLFILSICCLLQSEALTWCSFHNSGFSEKCELRVRFLFTLYSYLYEVVLSSEISGEGQYFSFNKVQCSLIYQL